MIATPKHTDPKVAGSQPASTAERPMIAQQVDTSSSTPLPDAASGRRLRNILVLANIVGWILILVVLKLVFF